MKLIAAALLYTGLMLGANAALATDAGEIVTATRGAALRGLSVHADPKDVPEVTFVTGTGTGSLADYRGKFALVNFWAVWCAPCREEMGTLSALEAEFGGDDFAVVTIATGPNQPAAIDKFLAEIGVANLPRHRDPRSALARALGVFGLPVTMLLDREGREVARASGPADWHGPEARAMVAALIEAGS